MELTYYDSKDAGGSAVQYYDTATVVSESGSIAFDRSVYPVPFTSGDLRTGSNAASLQTESGAVTAWITVSDADETNDTLTTAVTANAGTILIKHTLCLTWFFNNIFCSITTCFTCSIEKMISFEIISFPVEGKLTLATVL
jgi:hypothetical protein